MNKNSYWVLALVITVAISTRLGGLNLSLFLLEQKASIILSVLAGIFSVIGLYFLVKELFDEKLAVISSFLLAVSSWHVFVSRLGTKDIFISLALILAFYFIWHGLKNGHIFDFFLAGLWGGAGFYAGRSYFLAPLVVLLVFWNYWDYLKKDFSLSKYEQTKAEILRGFSLLIITTIIAAIPVGIYIWLNPEFLFFGSNSIFTTTDPLAHLFSNIGWITSKLILLDFSSTNLVSWPVSIFFAVGFIKELIHWLKRKHGHFSVVHTFVFSWLFIMPIPMLLSADMPSILSSSVVLIPVVILAAKGLWWVIEKLNRWEHMILPHPHKHYLGINAGPFLALIALIVSIAVLETF